MGAGESARGQAEKARRKAERLLASAERWEKGAVGERRTAEALAALSRDWFVGHDLAWPGRPYANLDHVVVGPTGIVVIDTKNWSGSLTVRDGILRQNGYRREKEVDAAAEAALAVGALVPEELAACRAVLCFVTDEPLLHTVRGVTLCSTRNLRNVVEAGPQILGPAQVQAVVTTLSTVMLTRAQSAPARSRPRRAATSGTQRAPRKPRTARHEPRRRAAPTTRERLVRVAVAGVLALVLVAALPMIGTLVGEVVGSFVVPEPTSSR